MKKTIFLAIATVLMAVQLWGQTPPEGTPYIELTVEENSGLKLDFKGNVANTTVWVETSPGNYESKVIGTNWCGYQTYSISGTEVKVYGNLDGFDCGLKNINEKNKVSSVNIVKSLNLTVLFCGYNLLTFLDVSQNANLERLYCGNNLLTFLDVSQNVNLNLLRCNNNQLNFLNVANGNNANFENSQGCLDARNNPDLSCIDVDEGFNPPVRWLKDATASWENTNTPCYMPVTPPAGMPYIELTKEEDSDLKLKLRGNAPNTPVWVENISGNYYVAKYIGIDWCDYQTYYIEGTKVKVYGKLKGFDCGVEVDNEENKVTSLNIEKNLNLTELFCAYNKLVYLNVANGNNANFSGSPSFDARNNPDLTCIKVDEGFNPPSSWEKDDVASWNNSGNDCGPPTGTPYIELTVEENSDLKLNLMGTAPGTLIWIETSPGNYESKVIGTNWCGFQTYSISGTEVKVYGKLKGFNCGVMDDNEENKVTSLNIEKNLNLTELYCAYNNIASLVVSPNANLVGLICSHNKLTAIDVSQNVNLIGLDCSHNKLTYLNIANGNNTHFVYFDARNNPNLTCIKVDEGFNPPSSDWYKDDTAEWRNDGTDCETSISQLDDAGIQLYPNPASGQISVSVPDSYIHNDMVIYNLLGQSLMRIPLNDANQSVGVSSLKPGVYIVKIGQNASKLIIK